MKLVHNSLSGLRKDTGNATRVLTSCLLSIRACIDLFTPMFSAGGWMALGGADYSFVKVSFSGKSWLGGEEGDPSVDFATFRKPFEFLLHLKSIPW